MIQLSYTQAPHLTDEEITGLLSNKKSTENSQSRVNEIGLYLHRKGMSHAYSLHYLRSPESEYRYVLWKGIYYPL